MEPSHKNWTSWWNLLIVLPWVFGVVSILHEWQVDRSVAPRQQSTSATITDHQPANHNTYGYEFFVEGKRYMGRQSPSRDELAVGKRVTVFYDPLDPAKNSLTDFHELTVTSLGPIPLLLFGIGAVALIVRSRRRRMAAAP